MHTPHALSATAVRATRANSALQTLAAIALVTLTGTAASAQYTTILICRASATGSSTFRLPISTTILDATPDVNDTGLVTARVSTDSTNFRQGIFVGNETGSAIVYNGGNDVTLTDPTINNSGLIVYGAAPAGGLRAYNSVTTIDGPLTFGVPGTFGYESPRLSNTGRIAYRGRENGQFAQRTFDLHTINPAGTVRLVREVAADATSPFNFVFNPAISPMGTAAIKLQRGSLITADEVWVYPASGSAPVRVAAETGAANPGLFTGIDNGVSVTDDGRVVFLGTLASTVSRGVYIVTLAGDVQTIAVQSPSQTIAFFNPDINNRGQVVFRTQAGSTQSIIVSNATTTTTIASIGQSITTDLGPTTFTGFLQNPRINERGDVVFGATLAAGGRGIFLARAPLACGPSDIASAGPTAGPDGELTADDIILFINAFTSGNPAIADVAGPGPVAGPDGELTADDIILFINRFTQNSVAGCP